MATTANDTTGDAVIRRVRDLNEQIVESARRGGDESLEAYENLLKTVADYQQNAAEQTAEWVTALGRAQASVTRELAQAFPSAARSLGHAVSEGASAVGRQARRVPGVAQAEGEVKGAVSTGDDLPISNYDNLTADQIVSKLSRLSDEDLARVSAYERRHDNRKTVLDKIDAASS
jgi:uncharacterized damage-inducible protein DinB